MGLNKFQLWSEGLVGLGRDFGIYGGGLLVGVRGAAGRVAGGRAPTVTAAANLMALTALDETRTKIDLPALIERLYTPIQNLEDDLDLKRMKF